MALSSVGKEYQKVEEILRRITDQRKAVKSKETPFRVEYRYPRGTKHFCYFTDIDSAKSWNDRSATYSPSGLAVILYPLSQQIQVKGPRGGWKRWRDARENPEKKN